MGVPKFAAAPREKRRCLILIRIAFIYRYFVSAAQYATNKRMTFTPLIPDGQNLVSDPANNHLSLDLNTSLYAPTIESLVTLGGQLQPRMDFYAVVDVLEHTLRLGLSDLQNQAFALLLTGLSQTQRFRNEIFVEPKLGDNTAIHSCHSAVLLNELFRRAGLLDDAHQTPEIIVLRVQATISALVHDMGEILGEPTTLAERQNNADLMEANDYERPVFAGFLRMAFWAVENRSVPEFYHTLQSFRRLATFSEDAPPDLRFVQYELRALNGLKVSAESEKSIAAILNAYDVVESSNPEIDSSERQFVAALVKTVERLQGLRHYTRFGTKDLHYTRLDLFNRPEESSPVLGPFAGTDEARNTIAFIHHYSPMILKQGVRMEENLPKLFAHAATEAQQALARTVRNAVYISQVEWYNAGPPFVQLPIKNGASKDNGPQIDEVVTFNYGVMRDLPIGSEARRGVLTVIQRRIHEYNRELARSLRAARLKFYDKVEVGDEGFWPQPLHFGGMCRRDALMCLYLCAIEADYVPQTKEPLLARAAIDLPQVLAEAFSARYRDLREQLRTERLAAIARRKVI